MATSTNATPGVLHPDGLLARVRLDRVAAPDDLAGVLDHLWTLAWDLGPGEVHRSSLAPDIAINLSVERPVLREVGTDADVLVTGTYRRRFDVDLRGRGLVVGAKLAPGALTAATGVAASGLVDRTLAAREVVGPAVAEGWGRLPAVEAAARPGAACELLAAWVPAVRADASAALVQRLLATARDDDALVRVDDLAHVAGTSVRGLQRLFRHYVGLTPKAVLRRLRIIDVVGRIPQGEPLAELAVRYGWTDQSHLTRDFTALVGVPPSAYRAGRPVR